MFRGLALAVTALALAACGGATLPPPAASQASVPGVPSLPAGTYTSQAFQPPVTFTVPDGWILASDSPLYLALQPAGNDAIGVHLFRDPSAASQDPSCPASAEPGVGGTSSALSRWILERPGLNVTPPTMASVGGLSGVSLDISLKADWVQACPFANGIPSVPLFNSPSIDHWVVVGNERLRASLLDLPGGGTVVVDQDAFDGAQFEDLLAASSGIVRSLTFDTSALSTAPSAAPASATP